MALEVLVSGRYTASWNALDTGVSQNGYELLGDTYAQDINQSDAFGDTIFDSIFRGANWSIIFETYKYAAAAIAAWYPWNATLGNLGTIGVLASDAAKSLVLTSTPGTPAAAAPASLTGTKSILAPGQTRTMLDSRVRTLPIRMRLYPFDAGGGVIRFFALT